MDKYQKQNNMRLQLHSYETTGQYLELKSL